MNILYNFPIDKMCGLWYNIKFGGSGAFAAQHFIIFEVLCQEVIINKKIGQSLCNLPYQYFIIPLHAKMNYRVSFPRYIVPLLIR